MESTTTRIDSNLCSSNKIKVIIPLNSICSVEISPCFDDQNSSLYISCTHLIIMTWLFSKYSRHIKTRWIISWLNILTLTVQFHITFWQKKKWKLHELISHLYEAEWKHFSLTMKQLFLLPIWFRDPVNPKQREIAKICQMMKKITLWSNHLR